MSEPLFGELTWLGDLNVEGDRVTGVVIEIEKEHLKTKGSQMLFAECVILTKQEFDRIIADAKGEQQ